jgi:Ni/Co efflux regulator RcnB
MQQHRYDHPRGARPFPAVAAMQHRVADLLALADVRIDGERPWDMQVHDPRVFGRLLALGSLGLGDSYMDGDWDTGDLDGLLFRLLDARLDEQVRGIAAALDALRAQLLNLQGPARRGDRNFDRRDDRRDFNRRDDRRDYDRRDYGRRDYGQQQYQQQYYYGARSPEFRRGGYIPREYYNRQYYVNDWRGHHLSAPPRGYQWVQEGCEYVLIALATGLIANLMLNQ